MKKTNNISVHGNGGNLISDIVKSVIITLILSVFLIVVTALIFEKFKISDENTGYISLFLYYFSFVVCGFLSGIKSNFGGWKSGLTCSFVYVTILFLIGITDGITFGLTSIVRIFAGLILGVTGGVLGVNFKYSKKTKKNKRHK